MADPEKFKEVVDKVLNSKEFQEGLQSLVVATCTATQPLRLPPSPATGVPQPSVHLTAGTSRPCILNRTVQEEFRQLFRPHRGSVSSTSTPKSRSKRKYKDAFAEYSREVIVLNSINRTKTLNSKEKANAYLNSFIRRLTFSKEWAESTVTNSIKTAFPVLGNREFEFLFPCGRELLPVPLEPGEELNGLNMHKIFTYKTIYIRPKEHLELVHLHEDKDHRISENEFNNIIDVNINDDLLDDTKGNDIKLCNGNISEDEALEQALTNSLTNSADSTPLTFWNELKNIQSRIKIEAVTTINVTRQDVLNCLWRAFNRKSFEPLKKLDILFVEEGSIDGGGPTREMWHLALEQLRNSHIFEGKDYSKNVNFNLKEYQEKKYFEAGRTMAMSLIHGGPGPCFLSKTLFSCLQYGIMSAQVTPTLEDVGCMETYLELKKAVDAETVEELQSAINESLYLQGIGVFPIVKDIAEKNKIVEGALEHYVLHLKREAIEQLMDGLNVCSIYELLQKYPDIAEKLLCFNEDDKLTVQRLNNIFKITYSEEGTHNRTVEHRIVAYWRDYLQNCEDEESAVTLENVLAFATGASKVPPLGFPVTPSIEFLHDEDSKFPKASTCLLVMYLPIVELNFNQFKDNMDFAIVNGGCAFGFA